MTISSVFRFATALSFACQFAVAQPATPTAQGALNANGVYSVQSGDTLYGIATRYGMSVGELLVANDLPAGAGLSVGQGLIIPGQQPVEIEVAAATSAPSGTHRIASGETLYSIARQYSVSVADLSSANGITDPSQLAIGQTLIIPGQQSAVSTPPTPVTAAAQTHTVVAGQTLYAISRQYGVSVDELRAQNGLTDGSQIFVGQVLQISAGQVVAGIPVDGTDVTDPTSQVFLGAVNDVPVPSERSVTSQSAAPLPATNRATAPSTSGTTVPVTTAPNTRVMLPNPPPRRSSKFHWPARGKILTRYGAQSNGLQSDGIEIEVTPGQAIKASEDGIVAFAGTGVVGFGHVVVIEHADGYHTAYMKNGSVSVKRGQRVNRGQTIASAGSEGRLHFELRHNSDHVNPIAYMVR